MTRSLVMPQSATVVPQSATVASEEVADPVEAVRAAGAGPVQAESGVDPARWPDIATVPHSLGRARLAEALVRRVATTMPIHIQYPDGTRLPGFGLGSGTGANAVDGPGSGSDGAPVLVLNRPEAFYRRIGANGLIGFGESYQAGDWDCADLVGLVAVFADGIESIVPRGLRWLRHVHGPRFPRSDRNTVEGSRNNIHRHYDLSNELFALFLDETMMYSSAIFEGDDFAPVPFANLPDAQRGKLDRLLDLANVRPGQRVLEIGTGWGELAIRAAQRGATVHTVTISKEQADLARRRAAEAGVADRIDVDLRDYRQIETTTGYDAVISVEMIEAVGEKFWPTYFRTLDHLVARGGHIALQAITMRHDRMVAARRSYTWIHKYIFPGGLIPSVRSIEANLARYTSLRVTQRFDFGQHYAHTLKLWRERFTERAGDVAKLGFDETFRRTWRLYLAYSEAGFRTGYLDVSQLLLTRTS